MMPYKDHNNHVVLHVDSSKTHDKYIRFNVRRGLRVAEIPSAAFNSIYSAMPDYPVEDAVKHFRGYAENYGATKEALKYLQGAK